MPCDSIQTTTVEFGKNTDTVLLADAMKALNYTGVRLNEKTGSINADWISFDAPSGVLSTRLSNPEQRANDLKREYSKQVVVAQAQKFGWKVAPLEEGRKEQRHVRV